MENENTLEINTSGINSICSKYEEMINTLELDCSNLVNDFKPLLNCGILSSFIPGLKMNVDAVVSSSKEMNAFLLKFAEEQENIDNTDIDNGNNNGNNSGGGSTKEKKSSVLSEDNINKLFSDDHFMDSFLSIVKEYPNILLEEDKSDLLKELLLKDINLSDDVKEIIYNSDSEIIQVTLSKIINGEIIVANFDEYLEKIKEVIIRNLNDKIDNPDSHKI